MRDGIISIGLDASTEPDDGFGVGLKLHFGDAHIRHPSVCQHIARRQAERLVDMKLCFCTATKKNLRPTRRRVHWLSSYPTPMLSRIRQCLESRGSLSSGE